MGLTLLIIAVCIIFGLAAWFAAQDPVRVGAIREAIRDAEPKRFSPRRTLFVIGPSANAHACRIQRKLLKPAIATLIGADVCVIEVYGQNRPRKNGEPMQWLDASLLRHAMDAEDGFFVIYVDDAGKTLFRCEAPMLAGDILARAGLDAGPLAAAGGKKKSLVLKKLRAA